MASSPPLRFIPLLLLATIFVSLAAALEPLFLATLPIFILSGAYLYVWHRTEYARPSDRWSYLLWALISIPFAPFAWLIMIREILAYMSKGKVRYLLACSILLTFLFFWSFFTASSSILAVSPIVQGRTTPYLDLLQVTNWFLPGVILLMCALVPRATAKPVES